MRSEVSSPTVRRAAVRCAHDGRCARTCASESPESASVGVSRVGYYARARRAVVRALAFLVGCNRTTSPVAVADIASANMRSRSAAVCW